MAEKKKESELDKARGTTESQQALRKYHEGEFQTTDPVTGEARNPGGVWQNAEDLEGNIIGEELSPEEVEAAREAEIARSTEGSPTPARKTAARKAARKSSR
jgi:hypothetical protein